jgi:hypothetical protein
VCFVFANYLNVTHTSCKVGVNHQILLQKEFIAQEGKWKIGEYLTLRSVSSQNSEMKFYENNEVDMLKIIIIIIGYILNNFTTLITIF